MIASSVDEQMLAPARPPDRDLRQLAASLTLRKVAGRVVHRARGWRSGRCDDCGSPTRKGIDPIWHLCAPCEREWRASK